MNNLLWSLSLLGLVAAPVLSEDFLVSDFNDRVIDNALGSTWDPITDVDSHGNSRLTVGDTNYDPVECDTTCFGPGYGSAGYAFKMGFVYGDSMPHGDGLDTGHFDPEMNLETQVLDTLGSPGGDLTGATSVSFWAKADKNLAVRFIVGQTTITDYAYHGQDIAVTTQWKKFTITFSDTAKFHQPDWAGEKVPFDIAHINSFDFNISKGNNASVTGADFYLDDFTVQGWAYHPSAIRFGARRSASAFSAVQSGRSLKVGLPESYRNIAGTVAVVDASGKEIARAAFAKGAKHLVIDLGDRAAVGRKFARILPAR
jgi:hypothetical protein